MITLGLKITNWCDQECPHCMSRSSKTEAYNFMPVETADKIIKGFKQVETPKWEDVFLTGGECMAPYTTNDFEYMDDLLNVIYKNNMFAKLNTNATWATKELLCERCLYHLAGFSYTYGCPVSLNLSVDEYHKNTKAVANVLSKTLENKYLSDALQINLASFNTPESKKAILHLIEELKSRGVEISHFDNIIGLNHQKFVQCYNKELLNIGRAFDNKIPNATLPSGHPIKNGDILVVDNKDTATLNHKWSEIINGRDIPSVLNALSKHTR